MSYALPQLMTPLSCPACRLRALFNRVPTTLSIIRPNTYARKPFGSRRFESTAPPIRPDPKLDKRWSHAVRERIEHLGGLEELDTYYPRATVDAESERIDVGSLFSKSSALEKGQTNQNLNYRVTGRVMSMRDAGQNLVFLTITDGTDNCQVVLNTSYLDKTDHKDPTSLVRRFAHDIRRGDWICAKGWIHKTPRGQPSLLAHKVPTIVSPSLETLSLEIKDREFLSRNRHVDSILHPEALDIIKIRSAVTQGIRNFLLNEGFTEVQTPLLVADAGGAIARPFETISTEFSDRMLQLRIAPELFLKRLMVGNMDKVFEIGPAFRNEGVDATHNPEFTICEFYQRDLSLDELIARTEQLFEFLRKYIDDRRLAKASTQASINQVVASVRPFQKLDFIPALEAAVQKKHPTWTFPAIDEPSAPWHLHTALTAADISLPPSTSIPPLLDHLAAAYLEPQCHGPTWITYHPACMSPLAKHISRRLPGGITQNVSARAELFIAGREYVNCYEEENSPVEQRRKLEQQSKLRAGPSASATTEVKTLPDDDAQPIDEDYVNALTSGMPPTGGWGCGVDRFVMLFAGKERIADVLPFGNLRHVVAMRGTAHRDSAKS